MSQSQENYESTVLGNNTTINRWADRPPGQKGRQNNIKGGIGPHDPHWRCFLFLLVMEIHGIQCPRGSFSILNVESGFHRLQSFPPPQYPMSKRLLHKYTVGCGFHCMYAASFLIGWALRWEASKGRRALAPEWGIGILKQRCLWQTHHVSPLYSAA